LMHREEEEEEEKKETNNTGKCFEQKKSDE
jgi:hypothetical protein